MGTWCWVQCFLWKWSSVGEPVCGHMLAVAQPGSGGDTALPDKMMGGPRGCSKLWSKKSAGGVPIPWDSLTDCGWILP